MIDPPQSQIKSPSFGRTPTKSTTPSVVWSKQVNTNWQQLASDQTIRLVVDGFGETLAIMVKGPDPDGPVLKLRGIDGNGVTEILIGTEVTIADGQYIVDYPVRGNREVDVIVPALDESHTAYARVF